MVETEANFDYICLRKYNSGNSSLKSLENIICRAKHAKQITPPQTTPVGY
jgi:hypothetical protein